MMSSTEVGQMLQPATTPNLLWSTTATFLCARLIDVIAEAENDVLLRSTEDNGKT